MDDLELVRSLLAEIHKAVDELEDAYRNERVPSHAAVIGAAGFIKNRADDISSLCEAEITIRKIYSRMGG